MIPTDPTDPRLLTPEQLQHIRWHRDHRLQGPVTIRELLDHIEAQAERIEALEAGLAAAHAELRR